MSLQQREFSLSLYFGEANKERKEDRISSSSPFKATRIFLERHFPDAEFFPLRIERPCSDDKDRLFSVWSAGTTASGQRVWIREQIGGPD